MMEEIKYSKEARKAILNGIDTIADAIKMTLGPKGRNVMIEREFGSPLISNDGATIVREIDLKDHFDNIGAQLINQVATKANDEVGDGTTTSVILAQSMIHKALDAIDKGANPVFVKEGMEKALNKVVEKIKEYSILLNDEKDLAHIASISCGSKEIGNMIGEALIKTGEYGYIDIEKSNNFETSIVYKKGMHLSQGYISPLMANGQKEIILENPYILITDQKIETLQDIIKILEKIVDIKRPLLIFADDISNEVLTTLLLNKESKVFESVVVKLPYYAEKRENQTKDLATFVGATINNKELNIPLSNFTIEDLGTCEKAIITKENTTIINGKGNVKERIKEIKAQLSKTKEGLGTGILRQRLAELTDGVAEIRVGGESESEFNELRLRVEDAIHATRAAKQEGIVLGAGLTFVQIYKDLCQNLNSVDKDIQYGIKVVLDSLLVPLYQIAENAGYDGEQIVNEQLKKEKGIGFDARSGKWVNIKKEGIIDPAKVLRMAISSAVSISSLFITSEVSL